MKMRVVCEGVRSRRIEGSGGIGCWLGVSPPAGDEEAVRMSAVSVEQNDVAGVEAFVLDVTAPSFCQDIALAAVPVGVTESPQLP